MVEYPIDEELSIPAVADRRNADPTLTEIRRAEKTTHGYPRVIGGDKGDIGFAGYTVCEDRTVLYKPVLLFFADIVLTSDEAFNIASDILANAYDSIGVECVERS